MEKNQIITALKQLRESNKKRNFSQAVEFIIPLKDINIKKPEQQIELFVNLPHATSKKVKVCAFTGTELTEDAKTVFDTVISHTDFSEYQDNKKKIKEIAASHDYFVAQANIMGQVAQVFGRVLGPRGKMPNPKAGCVLPSKGAVQPVYNKLQTLVKITNKKVPVVCVRVGDEAMSDSDLADNVLHIYKQTVSHLPNEENNVKMTLLKFTMSKPIKV